MNKNRVLVGMSGGVDSSVAAALLVEQGWDVIGLTITPFKIDDECRVKLHERSCCDYQSIIDSMDICEKLGIPHHFIDLSEAFKTNIVDNFVSEYLNGRTPNPCVNCNPAIKWGGILSKADELDAYYMATGHYASVSFSEETGRYFISKGSDSAKDQSYFLWKLSQEQISRTVFPIGEMVKDNTRELARKYNLKVSEKLDSQEVCFVPDNDYRTFLEKKAENSLEIFKEGQILFDGIVVGKHKGYPFYTIGQRKGLGVSYHKPLFVKNIIPETNTVEVGVDEELFATGLIATDINLIKYDSFDSEKQFIVKIRYRDPGEEAICKINSDGKLEISFLKARRAIAPGQSVVIYEGNDLVGGGVIERAV